MTIAQSVSLETDFETVPVSIRFVERCLGGVPRNPELIETWLAARAKPPAEGQALEVPEWSSKTASELKDLIEPTPDKSWCGFQRDPQGIFLPQIQVLAFIRDMASTLGYIKTLRGVRQTLQHTMCLETTRLRFERDGVALLEADGFDEHAVHVMTPQGPRTSIVRSDYVEVGTELRFSIMTARKREPKLTREVLIELFRIGGLTNGIGARRSQGCGRFELLD